MCRMVPSSLRPESPLVKASHQRRPGAVRPGQEHRRDQPRIGDHLPRPIEAAGEGDWRPARTSAESSSQASPQPAAAPNSSRCATRHGSGPDPPCRSTPDRPASVGPQRRLAVIMRSPSPIGLTEISTVTATISAIPAARRNATKMRGSAAGKTILQIREKRVKAQRARHLDQPRLDAGTAARRQDQQPARVLAKATITISIR